MYHKSRIELVLACNTMQNHRESDMTQAYRPAAGATVLFIMVRLRISGMFSGVRLADGSTHADAMTCRSCAQYRRLKGAPVFACQGGGRGVSAACSQARQQTQVQGHARILRPAAWFTKAQSSPICWLRQSTAAVDRALRQTLPSSRSSVATGEPNRCSGTH